MTKTTDIYLILLNFLMLSTWNLATNTNFCFISLGFKNYLIGHNFGGQKFRRKNVSSDKIEKFSFRICHLKAFHYVEQLKTHF